MQKLLVICPSRGRSESLMEMIRTFKETTYAGHSKLIVLLDEDDEDLKQYLSVIPDYVDKRVYNKQGMFSITTEIINKAFDEFKDVYEFFSVTNDDIRYKSMFWDIVLSAKQRISTGFEPNMFRAKGQRSIGFPVISVIDADICRAVGWLQYPKLMHCMGDNVWYEIGKRLKILNFDPQVVFEHENPFIGDWEKDKTFERVNAPEIIDKEVKVFTQWRKYEVNNDLDKIKENVLNVPQYC